MEVEWLWAWVREAAIALRGTRVLRDPGREERSRPAGARHRRSATARSWRRQLERAKGAHQGAGPRSWRGWAMSARCPPQPGRTQPGASQQGPGQRRRSVKIVGIVG